MFSNLKIGGRLPAENTKNQIKHEEWTNNDERDEEGPVVHIANSIVHLEDNFQHYTGFHIWEIVHDLPSTWWGSTPPWWRTGTRWAWRGWCRRRRWSRCWAPPTSPGTRSGSPWVEGIHHISAPLFYLCVHCIKMVISTADAEIKLSKLFHYVSQPQNLTRWDAENQNYINYTNHYDINRYNCCTYCPVDIIIAWWEMRKSEEGIQILCCKMTNCLQKLCQFTSLPKYKLRRLICW